MWGAWGPQLSKSSGDHSWEEIPLGEQVNLSIERLDPSRKVDVVEVFGLVRANRIKKEMGCLKTNESPKLLKKGSDNESKSTNGI